MPTRPRRCVLATRIPALTAGLLALVACGTGAPRADAGERPAEHPRTVVHECPGGPDFVVRMGPGEIGLFLPDRFEVLAQVPAASGAKYREGDLTYWTQGDEALLEIGEARHAGCLRVPAREPWEDARLRGAAFRATGNEPGWHLEIEPMSRIVLISDYGETRVETPVPTPEVDARAGARVYRARTEAHQLDVAIRAEECRDDMSGDRLPATVGITLDGDELRGCGRELGPVITGDYRLVGFGDSEGPGDDADAGGDATLSLDAWGLASGSSGCNRFTGSYRTDVRPALSFGPLASTRRACPPPHMELESRFLAALGQTAAYRLPSGTAESGAELHLLDAEGATLLVLAAEPE